MRRQGTLRGSKGPLRLAAGVLASVIATTYIVTTVGEAIASDENAQQQASDEQQAGASIYEDLKSKRELIQSSPLYAQLQAAIEGLVAVAQPRYEHPIKILLIHDAQPNAFATPGGNVYVTDELLYFVHSREELAGVLCHEVSHLIHHDSEHMVDEQLKVLRRELGAAILLGPSGVNVLTIALIGRLRSLKYSRDVESRADLTGSEVCAASGHNPWGLVWLFRDFSNAQVGEGPEILSDHPDDESRIAALERHIRERPDLFSRFNSDARSAQKLEVSKDSPVVFLR